MKIQQLKFIVMLLIFLLFIPEIIAEEKPGVRWVTAKSGLRMRDKPTLKGKIQGVIPYREKIHFFSADGDWVNIGKLSGRWSRIKWKNKTAWVYGGLLSKEDPYVTILYKAIFSGNMSKVNDYLAKVSINCKNEKGFTPLIAAAQSDNISIVKYLLDKNASLEVTDNDGWTAFAWTVQNNRVKIAKLLHAYGAKINVVMQDHNNHPNTTLQWAIVRLRNHEKSEMTKFLLSKGAKINLKDYEGQTPLHGIIQIEDSSLIRFFIKKGAKINAQDNKGRTPLHLAYKRSYSGIIKLLLDNGASDNIRDSENKRPSDYKKGDILKE